MEAAYPYEGQVEDAPSVRRRIRRRIMLVVKLRSAPRFALAKHNGDHLNDVYAQSRAATLIVRVHDAPK